MSVDFIMAEFLRSSCLIAFAFHVYLCTFSVMLVFSGPLIPKCQKGNFKVRKDFGSFQCGSTPGIFSFSVTKVGIGFGYLI